MARLSTALREPALGQEESFGSVLKNWRRERGLSQFQLALEAAVSPRHLSFLETSRSRPSRAMVARLVEALNVPLRGRNAFLLAAGFAPHYPESAFSEERMGPIRRVVEQLLERHDPYPAYAMDGGWNVLAANRTHEALLKSLLPRRVGRPVNILQLLFSPELLRPHVLDWEQVARAVLQRVLLQVQGPHRCESLAETLEEVSRFPGVLDLLPSDAPLPPEELFLPLGLSVGSRELRFITTLLTFGAALDVTVSEIVVECFFPSDEETKEYMESLGTSGGVEPVSSMGDLDGTAGRVEQREAAAAPTENDLEP